MGEKVPAIQLYYPFGSYLIRGVSDSLIFSHQFDLDGVKAIVENKCFLGMVTFEQPWQITLEDFNRYFESHRISDTDRKKLWPAAKIFYIYKVKAIFPALRKLMAVVKENKLFFEISLPEGLRLVSA
jgi:hypothetical protein